MWGIVSATTMQLRPNTTNFYKSLTLITIIVLGAAYAVSELVYSNHFQTEVVSAHKAAEAIVANISGDLNRGLDLESVDVGKLAGLTSYELSIISKDGRLISSSKTNAPKQALDYSFFQDVRSALSGASSWLQSSDYSESESKLFVSYPLNYQKNVLGAVRLAKPVADISKSMQPVNNLLLLIAASLILAIWYFTNRVIRILNSPLFRLQAGVQKFAEGDLKHKLYSERDDHAGRLAIQLNKMAAQLHSKISEIEAQRNELDAVFSSMQEGVLLIGMDEKVIKINKSAFEMLGTLSMQVGGKSIEEVVRNINLQNYAKAILRGGRIEPTELFLHENKELTVQVYSSLISDINQKKIALMIVLNDITQLKQLETVRKDFVANVSHELKTPITSIQGFVETLLDGAMHNPEETKRFLEIIHRQTERLNTIFNDLLILAGLEKESGGRMLNQEVCDLDVLINSVIQVCHLKAQKKNLSIDRTEVHVKTVKASTSLLEQALVNFLDNAIKYSPPGKEIKIMTQREREMVRISVVDNGMGIEANHLGRIFERFYRIDQARSREEGGTGLGLSIVKHIALLHKGQVEVQSESGKGSIFSILLPAEQLIQS